VVGRNAKKKAKVASAGPVDSVALIVPDALPALQTQARTETVRAATIGAPTASEAGRAARFSLSVRPEARTRQTLYSSEALTNNEPSTMRPRQRGWPGRLLEALLSAGERASFKQDDADLHGLGVRRLTFDMRGAQKAQLFGHPLDGRVSPLVTVWAF
jgi:hypothetical protein